MFQETAQLVAAREKLGTRKSVRNCQQAAGVKAALGIILP
jgi:hypothetical protein